MPQWLQVDLEKAARIGSIELFTYWDGGRYRYAIETSPVDGEASTEVVDDGDGSSPSTASAMLMPPLVTHSSPRVNMLHDNRDEDVSHVAGIGVSAGNAECPLRMCTPQVLAADGSLRRSGRRREGLVRVDGLARAPRRCSALKDRTASTSSAIGSADGAPFHLA